MAQTQPHMTPTTIRTQLHRVGYAPIPVNGKIPPLKEWEKKTETNDTEIGLWSKLYPQATNTGILTARVPAIDIDIMFEPAAKAIEELARERFEERGYFLVRIGKAPKRAVLFRTDTPFKKLTLALVAPDGDTRQKIEVLGDGQQVVVHGIHPETEKPYCWHGGEPWEIPVEELPYISEDIAREFLTDAAKVLEEFGYTVPKTGKGGDDGPATSTGGKDWRELVDGILAGQERHDSIRDLAAKLIVAGMGDRAAINLMRSIVGASTGPRDRDWQKRYDDIPRAVRTACKKYVEPDEDETPKANGPTPAAGGAGGSPPVVPPPPISPGVGPSPAAGASGPSPATAGIEAVHETFKRWLGKDYDTDVLNAALATAAAELLTGDPLWLLVVSGPGNAKTETVQALSGAGALVTSTIASEGALLSATPRQSRARQATGGLLRKIGDRGILVIKDVTSILSADRNVRAGVLSALREVHDGFWERNVGTDGGRTLTWRGRIVVVGAVTTAWDVAHSVISALGDRFVLIRADSSGVGRVPSALQAIGNIGKEIAMRKELAQAVGDLIGGINTDEYQFNKDELDRLVKAANVVTMARTAVERDYRGEVVDGHAPEMPTRFGKQLAQMVRGAVAIGIPAKEAMKLAIRCARDSMPPLQREILLDVAANPDTKLPDLCKRLNRPRMTT